MPLRPLWPRMQLSIECRTGPVGLDLERIKEMKFESLRGEENNGCLTVAMVDGAQIMFIGPIPEAYGIAEQINLQVQKHAIYKAPNVRHSVLPKIRVEVTDRR